MQPRAWNICLIEPNKFEAQIMVDLLRNAGCGALKVVPDSVAAMQALELSAANIIIAAVESHPIDGISWTKAFRRSSKVLNRKAPIFLTSRAFSRSMAEQCRHAGVNALIGKPISGKALIDTLHKVMSHPRQFIDAPNYVGPCRRAGIVTAGTTQHRRQADAADTHDAEGAPSLEGAVADTPAALAAMLVEMVSGLSGGGAKLEACLALVKTLQERADAVGDGPLMRACAALALHLSSGKLESDVAKAALRAGITGVAQLVATPVTEVATREAMAESVRQAVAKAALRAA